MTEKQQLFFVSLVYRRGRFCKAINDIYAGNIEIEKNDIDFIL